MDREPKNQFLGFVVTKSLKRKIIKCAREDKVTLSSFVTKEIEKVINAREVNS